jgi:hypothetical protein
MENNEMEKELVQDDWFVRLLDEQHELHCRLEKLRYFIETISPNDESYATIDLLQTQEKAMTDYKNALNDRITRETWVRYKLDKTLELTSKAGYMQV